MNITVGQRWQYKFEKYEFLVEITKNSVKRNGTIIWANEYAEDHTYPIGKEMTVDLYYSPYWTLLEGQAKPL